MKLKLIAPSTHTYAGFTAIYPKYNLLLVAALTPSSWEISIIDECIEEINFDEKADLVGITVTTSKANRAYAIADIYKSKGIKVVLGGIHPSIFPYEAIEHADAVVIGEAEYTWPMLINDFVNGSLKKFYISEKRHSLVSLPHPRRDLVKRNHYQGPDVLETSRGCPFKCEYCCTKFFGQNYRYRPIGDLVEEIRSIQHNYIVFMDDNILGNWGRAKKLFIELIPLEKHWSAQCTVNIGQDSELVNLAAKSGCKNLIMGFETLNEHNLVQINKKLNNVAKYEEYIKILHDHGIRTTANFIFGFDDDDESVFETTVNFVESNKIHAPIFWILTPYPGTLLYERLEEENRIIDWNWDNYDSRHVVFKPKRISPEKLYEGFWKAYKEITSFRSIFKRVFTLDQDFLCRLSFNLFIRKMAKQGIVYWVE